MDLVPSREELRETLLRRHGQTWFNKYGERSIERAYVLSGNEADRGEDPVKLIDALWPHGDGKN